MNKRDDRPMIEQLLEVLEQCRDMLRQMHQAQKDLKSEIKEAKETIDLIRDETTDKLNRQLEDALSTAVKRNTALLNNRLDKAREEMIDKFNQGFSSSYGILAALSVLLQKMYAHYESAETKLEIMTKIREVLDLKDGGLPTNP